MLLKVAGLFISPSPLVLIIHILYPRNVVTAATNPSPVLTVTGGDICTTLPFTPPGPGVHSLRCEGGREERGERGAQQHGHRFISVVPS